jgi:DNA-binding MarR family transcriptional regulator
MKPAYIESLGLIERLHRRFLEVVRGELERMDERGINNVQSLILFNMGDDELSVGELTSRGWYLGTNVSYNLKKLIGSGHVCQRSSPHDRRSVRVTLTEKGVALRVRLEEAFERHAAVLSERGVSLEDLEQMIATLGVLGLPLRSWPSPIRPPSTRARATGTGARLLPLEHFSI